MSALQAPASEQYKNWLRFPNMYRKPTDEEWACETDRLTAEISRLTENQRIQDSATAAVMERAAELERDAQRYRWLRENINIGSSASNLDRWSIDLPDPCKEIDVAAVFDAAIDAARGTE